MFSYCCKWKTQCWSRCKYLKCAISMIVFFYYCCRRCYYCCRYFNSFFFFFSVNASDTVAEYNKNENEKNKSEIDMIYYNHWFLARLMLSMRATFEKWLIDDVRAFVELASSKMRSMFNEQTHMRVRFDFFKIINAIMLLCRHFNNNVVVFS